jgi:hypothetical protein
MNLQYLDIGAAPCEEECAQVGRTDYPERSRRECQVFQRMLECCYPAPDRDWLKVKSFAHDFGSYREVCVYYLTTLPPRTVLGEWLQQATERTRLQIEQRQPGEKS